MSRAAAGALATLLLAACPSEEPACDEAAPAWVQIGRDLAGAALSVQGRAPDDVWVVGGGRGGGPLAAHWDGRAWTRPALPAANTTWWWSWSSPQGSTWLVGDGGAVRFIDAAGAATPVDLGAGPDRTLYGVWGTSDDDAWIVGTGDFVRRRVTGGWETPPGLPVRGADLFKVWGAAADDVWISGEGGTMLHWNGTTLVDHTAELATFAPALTVHGCSSTEVYAVAGQALFAWDGVAWARRAEPVLGSAANGVACGAGGVVIVGNAALKVRWERASGPAGPWLDERASAPSGADLHGAWIDADDRVWAVGGNFNDPTDAPRRGVAGVRGCPTPDPL